MIRRPVVAVALVFAMHSLALAQDPPLVAPESQEDKHRRVLMQCVAGVLATGAVGGIAFARSVRTSGDAEAMACLKRAIPLSIMAHSVAVYLVGKHYDQESCGSYGSTLGGTLIGFASGLGAMVLMLGSGDSTGTWVWGLSAMALLPTVGSVLSYNGSRAASSALLNVADGEVHWGLPVPGMRTYFTPDNHADIGCGLSLVHMRF